MEEVLDAPIAIYGQVVGEDEDKFLPNCLMFQYGVEGWRKFRGATLRFFAEYADLTSYWWTGDPVERNISYGHHIYEDGYRYRGRPMGIGQIRTPKSLALVEFYKDWMV